MKLELLTLLEEKVKNCTKCQELSITRTNTVFADGNVNSKLAIIGEAPGKDEDLQAKPFVGRAGQLLNNILKACNLTRENVYILNILKCRPPNNRNPNQEEITNCKPFLELQIKIVNPDIIICLGSIAAKTLLNTETNISELRGNWYNYKNIKVMPTYHPSFLLRNPAAKKLVWEDFKLVIKEINGKYHSVNRTS